MQPTTRTEVLYESTTAHTLVLLGFHVYICIYRGNLSQGKPIGKPIMHSVLI